MMTFIEFNVLLITFRWSPVTIQIFWEEEITKLPPVGIGASFTIQVALAEELTNLTPTEITPEVILLTVIPIIVV